MVVTGFMHCGDILANHQKNRLLYQAREREEPPFSPQSPPPNKKKKKKHIHAHTKGLYGDDEEGPFSSFFLLWIKLMNFII